MDMPICIALAVKQLFKGLYTAAVLLNIGDFQELIPIRNTLMYFKAYTVSLSASYVYINVIDST